MQIKLRIFLSYGHDSNAPLIEKIYEYLTNGFDGSPKHEVWIDKSEIKEGEDWRCRISEGIRQSDVVLAGYPSTLQGIQEFVETR